MKVREPKKFITPKTPEDQLAAMRAGNNQEMSLKSGDLEIPCRILTHQEESGAIASGKMTAQTKKPESIKDQDSFKSFEAAEIMKAVLLKATNVASVQHIGTKFLNGLSSVELDGLYDQWVTLSHTVNPEYEEMNPSDVAAMIVSVKKKEKVSKDFYTWQLAAIGKLYLDEIRREVSAPGS